MRQEQSLQEDDFSAIYEQCDRIARMLSSLIDKR
jgi:hypothetical protein